MLLHWIWLAHRPGLPDRVKAELMQHFADAEEVFHADRQTLQDKLKLKQEALDALLDKDTAQAEQILQDCSRERLQILTYRDGAYPARLKHIPDPPLVLYYRGRLPQFDLQPAVGIVGTRRASAYGMSAARRMGYQIASCGGIVVSGLAVGIDGMAMAGALSAGGTVVGVMGCGADVLYPVANRSLIRDVEKYGCLLSELPPGTRPNRWIFPKRNRIISGLCNGVLVVEAPEHSGALITASRALEQGRDVFVVPGNIDVETFVGSNRLLRQGAAVVSTGWDVMSEYQSQYPATVRRPAGREAPAAKNFAAAQGKPAQNPAIPGKKDNLKKKLDKLAIDKDGSEAYSDVSEKIKTLSPEEQTVLQAIGQQEKLVDDVIAQTGMAAGKLLSVLTLLELKGLIVRLPGKRVAGKGR